MVIVIIIVVFLMIWILFYIMNILVNFKMLLFDGILYEVIFLVKFLYYGNLIVNLMIYCYKIFEF